MTQEQLLADKLPAYRSSFETACAGLFDGDAAVTVNLDDDDDAAPDSNRGSKIDSPSQKDAATTAAVKKAVERALHDIAVDFAREFNTRLAKAASEDPSVAMVAPNYEMTSTHIDDLSAMFDAAVRSLLEKLDSADLDGARRASLEAWPLLERRIRTKWQAYFVFTFQDVSVERKAARDRRQLSRRFDAEPMAPLDLSESKKLRALPDLATSLEPRRGGVGSWIAAIAIVLLAAAGAWLLLLRH